MPTYDYICRACGHEFELFQQMSDSVKRKCPECGKPKLERLIGTGAGVLFKGGGFYETDYRSDSYTKAADADKKAAEGKSDATAADKKSPESAAGGESKTKADAAASSKSESSSSSESTRGGSRTRAAKPAASSKSRKSSRRK
jgi:putative FmdB family regulatory protein